MTPISVLIPTANRPAMLRTALKSVAAQTALSNIAEVVVIENLSCRESESVCREFPHLPIQYIFRDPPIPPGIHSARDAVERVRCEWTALLFDDDWWMERHLENSITAFEKHSDAVAAYAAALWTTGEEGYLTDVFGTFLPWFGAREPMREYCWTLDLVDLLVISQINTAFHYSSLVVKSKVFKNAIECTANGNPYDTDRLISVELGRYGKVICDSRPHAYIRTHAGQEALRISVGGESERWWRASMEQLLELAEKEHIDLKSEFSARMKAKSVTVQELRRYFYNQSYATLIKRNILEVEAECPLITRVYREITPPLLRKFFTRLRAGYGS